MQALEDLTISGKIRFVGLSNESPWGTMQMLKYKNISLASRLFRSKVPTICSTEILNLLKQKLSQTRC